MPKWKGGSQPEKPIGCTISQLKLLDSGLKQAKSFILKQRPEDITIIEKAYNNCSEYLKKVKEKPQNKKYAIAELVPKSNRMIWKDKKNILEVNTLATQLLETSALVLTGKDKVCLPFWTEQCLEWSKKLWLPIGIDSVDSDLNCSNGCSKETIPNLQLKTKTNSKLPEKNYQMTSSQLSQSMPAEKWENEGIRSKKVKLKLNNSQKQKLKGFFHTCRYVYNKSLKYMNDNKKYYYKEICSILTSKHFIDKDTRKKTRNENVQEWETEVPNHIRKYEVKKLSESYKGCFTRLKKGQIRKFEIKYRKKKENRQTITIPKSFITRLNNKELKICPTIIKDKIISKHKLPKIEYDCELIWSYPSEFHLVIPCKKIKEETNPTREVVSLDPGIRDFIVSYSEDEVCKINPTGVEKITNRIDNLKSVKDTTKKNKTKLNIKKTVLRLQAKLRNKITDFHYQTIKYLKEYKSILLPTFESQEFFGKDRKIRNKSARKLNILSHYKFKQRLIHSTCLSNSKVYLVNESYTSKTCTKCGKLNDIGNSKIYQCSKSSCEGKWDRDINGARNILLKHLL